MVRALLPLSLLVAACAVKRPDPVAVSYRDATLQFRDYRGVKVCRVAADRLLEDVRATSAFLEAFLAATGPEAPNRAQALAEVGEVPRVAEAHAALAGELETCGNHEGVPYAEGVRAVSSRVLERLKEGELLRARAEHEKVVAAWRAAEEAEQKTQRAACRPQRRGVLPDIFYAWAPAEGVIEWWFCDDSKVVRTPAGASTFVPGPKPTAKPDLYLRAAEGFPDEEVKRAPKGP